MAAVVEHDKRKEEILQKSIDVFMSEGYKDVTIQKIADHCGITRTTLYIYFKNKNEIFISAIKKVTKTLEKELFAIITTPDITCSYALHKVMQAIIDVLKANSHLFSVITDYLRSIKISGEDPNKRVMHFVGKLRHFLSQIMIKGMETGEFRKVDVKSMNELFYSMIEATIFRVVVLDQKDLTVISETVDGIINSIKA